VSRLGQGKYFPLYETYPLLILFSFSVIVWDASSEEALEAGLSSDNWKLVINGPPKKILLILENADASLNLEDYIHDDIQVSHPLHIHTLILSNVTQIFPFASHADCTFTAPPYMNAQQHRKFVDNVKKAFAPQQHIFPLVARGGTGKTQVTRKFVQEYGARWVKYFNFPL
jgi:hypothetical protein